MDDFYEGAEKSIYLGVAVEGDAGLLGIEREFWDRVLAETGCTILSEIKTEQCTAFLLSESSLFVWRRNLLFKTCGRTTPLTLVEELGRALPWVRGITGLAYSHGPFLREDLQPSGYRSVLEEAQLVKTTLDDLTIPHLPCLVRHFGNGAVHYLSGNPYRETVTEIQMVGLHPHEGSDPRNYGVFRDVIQDRVTTRPGQPSSPGKPWHVDERYFEPCGYSLNMVCPASSHYTTVHVTPQPTFSYVSLEGNGPPLRLMDVLPAILDLLKPTEVRILVNTSQPIWTRKIRHRMTKLKRYRKVRKEQYVSRWTGSREGHVVTYQLRCTECSM